MILPARHRQAALEPARRRDHITFTGRLGEGPANWSLR
jgi:hypothetical protein